MDAEGSAPKSSGTFKLEISRFTQLDKIVGIATLVLLISLFLPWFGVSDGIYGGSVDGLWHGYMYLTLLVCLALIAYLVVKAGFETSPVKLPVAEPQIFVIGTGLNVLLTVISFLTKPSGTSWDLGAYIGLIAAIVAVAPKIVPALNAKRKSV